jgi:quercetin dioxygenase-like cupin family protein
MSNAAIGNPGRRRFLCSVPGAVAAGLALTDLSFSFASASAQGAAQADATDFKLFRAEEVQDDVKALDANPGSKNFVQEKTITAVMTTEKNKRGAEFEWHEHRDHIVQILDGSTLYEVGGTPKNGHSTGPGEWLAPESEGHETMTLNKGDMLVIKRGTPHKRTTAESVAFFLISAQGDASA